MIAEEEVERGLRELQIGVAVAFRGSVPGKYAGGWFLQSSKRVRGRLRDLVDQTRRSQVRRNA